MAPASLVLPAPSPRALPGHNRSRMGGYSPSERLEGSRGAMWHPLKAVKGPSPWAGHAVPCPANLSPLSQLLAAGQTWLTLAGLGAMAPCLSPLMAFEAQEPLSLSASWKKLTVQHFLCAGLDQRVKTLTCCIVIEILKYFVLEHTEMPVCSVSF